MAPAEEQYHPKDAVNAAIQGTLVTTSAGVLIAAVQNTLTKRNVSSWGVFTRFGGTVATFTAMGGTYEFARNAAANLREKDDSLNTAIGGFLAGSILGLRYASTPHVLGYGALVGVVLSAYDYTGGSLRGFKKDRELDDFERKEALRKNRRRPIEETLSELGEGRGIYGPGYEQRRKERIKEKYGIDVPTTHA